MSVIYCLASDTPLETLPNPHIRLLSVSEALAQGITVPKCMLEDPEVDPEEPETYLWSDIQVEPDPVTGALPPEPEDNYDIWPIDRVDNLHTKLRYLAEIEWSRCTPVRAELLLDYIRRHLETAERVELWNLWQGSDVELVRAKREETTLAETTPEMILTLCNKNTAYPIPSRRGKEFQQFCLCISR